MNEDEEDILYKCEERDGLGGYEIENHILTCSNCKKKWHVRANIQRGFSDHEDIKCPSCLKLITNIRADMGYDIQEITKE